MTNDTGQKRPLVLVVDGEQEVLEKMTTVLGEAGFGCRCCTTAEAAAAAARAAPPDLIVCDLNLGGENGLETCRRIKEYPGLEDVPVMFLSGAQLPDVISGSRAAGGSYCLRKPFAPAVLVELIDHRPSPRAARGRHGGVRTGLATSRGAGAWYNRFSCRSTCRRLAAAVFWPAALAAGAGVVLLPRSGQSREPAADPNHFVLLADTHVAGRRDLWNRGVQPAKNLELAAAEIRALESRPAGAIVAGDCAFMHGEADDYATFRELVKPLRQAGLPIHLALGNHNQRERLLAAFPEVKSRAAVAPQTLQKCVSVVESPQANWFLLDSLDKTNTNKGLLGEGQLAWLAKALDARPERPALVLAHHNPEPLLNIHGLTDTAALFKVLKPRKQVKAYFFGHTHRWSLSRAEGHSSGQPARASRGCSSRRSRAGSLRPNCGRRGQRSSCTRSITSTPSTARRSS